MLDWLVVGGGPHGVTAALALRRRGVPAHRLRILDPHPLPLARWTACTRNTGMAYLRSPAPYHLDLDPMALHQHARDAGGGRGWTRPPFLEPYRRPSLEVFQSHAGALMAAGRLGELWLRGTALAVVPGEHGVEVAAREGFLRARNVVLAVGLGDQPAWPAWAASLRARGGPIDHLFAPGFDRRALTGFGHAAVVGGGISAAQAALALAPHGRVTLVMRHAPREHLLDSDGGWATPRLLDGFWRLDPAGRRRAIAAARHRGSIPPEIAQALRAAVARGEVALARTPIHGAAWEAGGPVRLLTTPGALFADRVVLATGFAPHRPGGAMLEALVADHGLPVAPCGYPLVDPALRWHPRIRVMGPLAELELGPVARNLVGGQLAAGRLLASLG